MLIVDAHQDLAWNMLTYGRDYTRSVEETRRREAGKAWPGRLEETLLGYPEYRRGRVAVVFSALFAAPQRAAEAGETQVYADAIQAERIYRAQIDRYLRLADEAPDNFRLIFNRRDLEAVVAPWRELPPPEIPAANATLPETEEFGEQERRRNGRRLDGGSNAAADDTAPASNGPPVGLVISMEGAEGIRKADEVEWWYERGVRIIGPAWRSTPYCGGTGEPGPLTSAGFELLERMADLKIGLDLTHMDETAALQALDVYPGPLLASHCNARALLRGDDSNRHLSDRVIHGIVERGGVIGIVPFIAFLKAGWKRGDRREDGRLEQIAAQIDYVCQIAGNARHVGFGTDFDGGFGRQSVPPGIESIADLHLLAPLLIERGYTQTDIAAIYGENWLGLLERILPESV